MVGAHLRQDLMRHGRQRNDQSRRRACGAEQLVQTIDRAEWKKAHDPVVRLETEVAGNHLDRCGHRAMRKHDALRKSARPRREDDLRAIAFCSRNGLPSRATIDRRKLHDRGVRDQVAWVLAEHLAGREQHAGAGAPEHVLDLARPEPFVDDDHHCPSRERTEVCRGRVGTPLGEQRHSISRLHPTLGQRMCD